MLLSSCGILTMKKEKLFTVVAKFMYKNAIINDDIKLTQDNMTALMFPLVDRHT